MKIAIIKSQVELPSDQEKKEIFKEYHEIDGHSSVNTMKFLILPKYRWENIMKDIEMSVKKCEICAKSGEKKQNSKNSVIKASQQGAMGM